MLITLSQIQLHDWQHYFADHWHIAPEADHGTYSQVPPPGQFWRDGLNQHRLHACRTLQRTHDWHSTSAILCWVPFGAGLGWNEYWDHTKHIVQGKFYKGEKALILIGSQPLSIRCMHDNIINGCAMLAIACKSPDSNVFVVKKNDGMKCSKLYSKRKHAYCMIHINLRPTLKASINSARTWEALPQMSCALSYR